MEQFDTLYTQCRHIEHIHEGVWFTKIISDKMTAMRTFGIVLQRGYACSIIVHTRADQLLSQLLIEHFILCLHNADTLNICMKEFGSPKGIIDKMAAMRTLTFFQACFNKKGVMLLL